MRSSESSDARPSRIALAVVLSTLSVAAIAGPLAFQALQAQKNEIRVGTVTPNVPTVAGVTSVVSTEPPPPSTEPSTNTQVEDAPQETAPPAITSTLPPAATDPPIESSATPESEPTLGEPVSVERTEVAEGTQELVEESSEPYLEIPSAPGAAPTWPVGESDILGTASLPTTTIPGDPGSSSSAPPTTEASTSGSVTTITEPLEPVDTSTSSAPATTIPPDTTSTSEPSDPVITEPLEPVDTTVPASTTTDPGSSDTTDSPSTTGSRESDPTSTSGR